MGREIRRVPAHWQHPMEYSERTRNPAFKPMMQGTYDAYEQEKARDAEEYGPEEGILHYTPDDFMPTGRWFQLFETVSEGTPLSPPFPTKAQLVGWLRTHADYWGNRWTPEQAGAIADVGWAPSGLGLGNTLYRSEDAALIIQRQRKS